MNKIIEIKLEKLFDVFNHNIKFNIDGISLILGENGFGKTILLKMIKALFEADFAFLGNVVFKSLTITFSNKIKWKVIKNTNGETTVSIQQIKGKEILNNDVVFEKSKHEIITKEGLDLTISIGEFLERQNQSKEKNKSKNLPNWYSDFIENFEVQLIETQRLLIKSEPKKESESFTLTNTYQPSYKETVIEYSKDLVNEIRNRLAKSTELAMRLDRTYPTRLADKRNKLTKHETESLALELSKLEKMRDLLYKVGLIDKDEYKDFQYDGKEDDFMKKVLTVYIDDSKKKLEIFDDLAQKIELFKQIINKRFFYKNLEINRKKGFIFTSKVTGKQIPLQGLSSGEQHEIVLFFTLLFKIKPNTLILIDEPEISLHVSWQNNFIKDLREIIELTDLDILIATHSPNIIGENWDIATELQGVEIKE